MVTRKGGYKSCFNLPEGRDGFKRLRHTFASRLTEKGFNLPEGRDGFKRNQKMN